MKSLQMRYYKLKLPGMQKNIANSVPSDKLQDWHNIKLDVMKEILVAKVTSCDKYRNALLGSGSNCLIEGTMDLYWGCGQTAYQGWGQVQLTKYSSTPSTPNIYQVQVLVKYSFLKKVLKYIKYFHIKYKYKYKYSY